VQKSVCLAQGVLQEVSLMAAVITGMGCVTPVGVGAVAFASALRKGLSGTGPLTRFDASPYACRVAAEVRDFRPGDHLGLREIRTLPRAVQFSLASSRMAMEDAQLNAWPDPARVGVLLGTSAGLVEYTTAQGAVFFERGVRRVQPTFLAYAHSGALASECAIQLGIHGPVLSTSSACTSGADALGLGAMMIASGMVDMLLVGASEAPLTPLLFASFDRFGIMSSRFNEQPERAARPFSADRDGFVLGEGSTVFLLEERTHALSRGARILAEVVGYGATCDASNHFKQDEQIRDAARAIEIALSAAGVTPAEVDYVHAHGSGTRHSDALETALLHRVLGEHARRVPVSSVKSTVGHCLGAASAIEVGACIAGIEGGFLPPTMNLEHPDPECDLDYVPNAARSAELRVALAVSFGYGSRNAALVLRDCIGTS
jgi:3-oxoacyl-[acyl-carrier-protein] synthase II